MIIRNNYFSLEWKKNKDEKEQNYYVKSTKAFYTYKIKLVLVSVIIHKVRNIASSKLAVISCLINLN